MANRAVITSAPFKQGNIGVYVHWHGDLESVISFCEACEALGYRSPETDSYGWAGLTYAIGLWFQYDGLSLAVDKVSRLDTDNGDNGTWTIANWKVVGNKYGRKVEPLGPAHRAKADTIRDTIIRRAKAIEAL